MAIQSINFSDSKLAPQAIKNTAKKVRHDFQGNSLDATAWQIVQTGAGQTVSVANSELTISSGTTINSETIIRGLDSYSIPFRAEFIASLSSRIANVDAFLEIVDSSGNHYARWTFTGTSNNLAAISTANNGTTTGTTNTSSFPVNTSSYQMFEIESSISSIDFFSKQIDSTSARNTTNCKTRQIPDPNLNYFIQIRLRNGSTAPASSVNFLIDAISIQDVDEIAAEITGARSGGGNLSLPVTITSGTVSIGGTNNTINTATMYFTETTTALAASGVFVGTSRDCQHRPIFTTAVDSDVACSLFIDESPDGTTWIASFPATSVTGGVGSKISRTLSMRYARVRIANGSSAQTTLRCYSSAYGA